MRCCFCVTTSCLVGRAREVRGCVIVDILAPSISGNPAAAPFTLFLFTAMREQKAAERESEANRENPAQSTALAAPAFAGWQQSRVSINNGLGNEN